MTTVKHFAETFACEGIIKRAFSFDLKLWNNSEAIWQTPVEYVYNLKNSAGNANKFRIHLHAGLKQASMSEQCATFLHELAHVCDCYIRNHSGHDYPWQEMMIRLAQNPHQSRYHNIASCKKRINPMDDLSY